jgi:hypothetical protein
VHLIRRVRAQLVKKLQAMDAKLDSERPDARKASMVKALTGCKQRLTVRRRARRERGTPCVTARAAMC